MGQGDMVYPNGVGQSPGVHGAFVLRKRLVRRIPRL